ncbi:hypothetical protein RZS08_46810, partial [Arthrospira platensis SPKY1]|nr:hypothetical protein [Arthrospira platensis SPKY1]
MQTTQASGDRRHRRHSHRNIPVAHEAARRCQLAGARSCLSWCVARDWLSHSSGAANMTDYEYSDDEIEVVTLSEYNAPVY